jgi:hypothetical protein
MPSPANFQPLVASAAMLLFLLPLVLAGASGAAAERRSGGWSLLLDVAALLLGVWLVGLPIASFVFVAAYTRLRFRLSWITALAAGASVALFEWALFERLLEIPLDTGILQRRR